jgi:hypothetical protein
MTSAEGMTSAENRYKNYQGKDPMSPERLPLMNLLQ